MFNEVMTYIKQKGKKILTFFPSKTDLICVSDEHGNVTEELLSEKLQELENACIEEISIYNTEKLTADTENVYTTEKYSTGDIFYLDSTYEFLVRGTTIKYEIGYYCIEYGDQSNKIVMGGRPFTTYLGRECANTTKKSTVLEEIKIITEEIESLKKSGSDGKTSVAAAITEMGVQTATNADFATMAANIKKIKSIENVLIVKIAKELDFSVGEEQASISIGEGFFKIGTFSITENMIESGFAYLIWEHIYTEHMEQSGMGKPDAEILWIVIESEAGSVLFDEETYDNTWVEEGEEDYISHSYIPVALKVSLTNAIAGNYNVYVRYTGANETTYYPSSHQNLANTVYLGDCYFSTHKITFKN